MYAAVLLVAAFLLYLAAKGPAVTAAGASDATPTPPAYLSAADLEARRRRYRDALDATSERVAARRKYAEQLRDRVAALSCALGECELPPPLPAPALAF